MLSTFALGKSASPFYNFQSRRRYRPGLARAATIVGFIDAVLASLLLSRLIVVVVAVLMTRILIGSRTLDTFVDCMLFGRGNWRFGLWGCSDWCFGLLRLLRLLLRRT